MVDLFGHDASAPVSAPPSFGLQMDELARRAGGWPDDHVVYAMEVIGDHTVPDPQVLLTGSPCQWTGKKWKFVGEAKRAVLRLSEYRAALSRDQEHTPC